MRARRMDGQKMSKEKDIMETNPVLTRPDFKQQLREWEKKQKELEQQKESK